MIKNFKISLPTVNQGFSDLSTGQTIQREVLQGQFHQQRLETAAGSLLLQNFTPPELIRDLYPASGLRAFARTPEREHELLIQIASRPDSALTLAYTPAGEIIGQVSLTPVDPPWSQLHNAHEISVEVSTPWRQLGVARHLLSLALELDTLEELMILAFGLSWHWDYSGLGISRFAYRRLIFRLFTTYGFEEFLTSDENITMDPANIFLARLGKALPEEELARLFALLIDSDHLL